MGLIREKTGNAAKILKSMDIKLKNMRLEIQKLCCSREDCLPERLPYNPGAKRLLGATVKNVQNMDVDYIATEYLLLGPT